MIHSPEGNLTKKSLVLSSPDWHPGVIGIVAARLTEEFYRPTILVALSESLGKGSGRSVDPFPLYQGIKACESWVEKFGGHEQAAGLVIRAERIPEFSRAFEETVAARLTEEDLIPCLNIDALTNLEPLNESFISELEVLAPFGTGNPEPVLGLESLSILNSKLVGKNHLRLRVQEGRVIREAIGFGMGSWHPLSGERMKMAFVPQLNIFRGKRSLQMCASCFPGRHVLP
jgi:single-stranded-DNA-specific exonuclease